MGRPYPTAPIVNSVIEVKFVGVLPNQLIERVAQKLRRNYANRTDAITREVVINPTAESASFGEPHVVVDFSSSDETERLRIQTQSLIFEQLAPYPGWDQFCGRFARDWSLIDKLVRREPIERIGVRFINRLDVPDDEETRLPNRFVTVAVAPPSQFQGATNVGVNYQADYGPRPLRLILNVGFCDSPILHKRGILLDIDVIAERSPPQATDEIFALLNEIRDLKNEIFEEAVTDVARNTFNI